MEINTRGLSRSLVTNHNSKFRNSKWWIQHGGQKCENSLDWDENLYLGVFKVTYYEFALKIWKFKMADPTWRA